ncbi:inorganic triphosphatase YgiF [Rhizobium sp. ERR 1071]|uniref:CYTH and CHAD domain-containing protein n=1 Tax=Rhizobium sp. ERR 1071 TaxID=2572677 RepID=UPI00119A54C3|nr:CHAD domain-containing protein [Rhizobium sp. ERR1071]TWB07809.1 inorganic triphosphatase YgiF [Rhizobium sp. ERR1071]
MSSETEVKLDLSPESFGAILGSDLLGEPEKIVQQRATYFDAADRRLWKKGFTLRIRQVGAARTQTVKAAGPGRSLFARSEWETPVEGDTPVLDHTSPLLGEFGNDLKLEPIFDVIVERRLWTVEENGSRLEVVVDQGEVVSGERSSPIREAEIELKDGSPGDLFSFARKIDEIACVRFGVRSKAERGYALAEAQKTAFKSEPLYLDRDMNAAAAFKAIASSCFRHFRLNEDILLYRRNAEALHQARVALRRLRSAFSIFKPMLPDEKPQRLNSELRWLAAVLGEARNVDVLLGKAADADLVFKLEAARESTYRDAVDALSSPRARALMLDLLQWLECGDYHHGNSAMSAEIPDALAFARRALDKQRKKLKKDGSALSKLDDEHRHEVRKDAKKLRYAAEFFASLFDDKRSRRRHAKFLAAMEALQDDLGALNDLVSVPGILEKHRLENHPSRDTVLSHAEKDALIDSAQAHVDDVLDAKRFWK